jgi:hypothetical protein
LPFSLTFPILLRHALPACAVAHAAEAIRLRTLFSLPELLDDLTLLLVLAWLLGFVQAR